MSFWDTLGHFFAHLFPHNAKEAQALLTEISPYVNLAGPIVESIETDLKPVLSGDQAQKAEALNAWLSKYVHDADLLEKTVNQLLAQPDVSVVLRDTAKAVVSLLLPANVSAPLNLIIETAYELYVVKAGKQAPTTLPAAA